MVQKPTDLIITDLRDDIIGKINESKLPISIIKYVVEDVLRSVNNQYSLSLDAAKKMYEDELANDPDTKPEKPNNPTKKS